MQSTKDAKQRIPKNPFTRAELAEGERRLKEVLQGKIKAYTIKKMRELGLIPKKI